MILLPSENYLELPVLYLENEYNILIVYSYDSVKRVLYVSDLNHHYYKYLSYFEGKTKNYKIVSCDRYKSIKLETEIDGDRLPF